MILFIFEGAKYEPPLYEGIKSLFFPKSNDYVLCSLYILQAVKGGF